RPARAQPPVSLREARHALPRPGRGALRHDRPGNGEGRRLGDAPRERSAVSREAPALFLADVAHLRAHRPLRVGDAPLGGAGVALAVLAKGLIGMFPVLIVGLGMAVVRGLAWRDLNAVRGAALFAAVAGPWHALVAWRSPALFEFYVLDAHLLRLLNARRYVE